MRLYGVLLVFLLAHCLLLLADGKKAKKSKNVSKKHKSEKTSKSETEHVKKPAKLLQPPSKVTQTSLPAATNLKDHDGVNEVANLSGNVVQDTTVKQTGEKQQKNKEVKPDTNLSKQTPVTKNSNINEQKTTLQKDTESSHEGKSSNNQSDKKLKDGKNKEVKSDSNLLEQLSVKISSKQNSASQKDTASSGEGASGSGGEDNDVEANAQIVKKFVKEQKTEIIAPAKDTPVKNLTKTETAQQNKTNQQKTSSKNKKGKSNSKKKPHHHHHHHKHNKKRSKKTPQPRLPEGSIGSSPNSLYSGKVPGDKVGKLPFPALQKDIIALPVKGLAQGTIIKSQADLAHIDKQSADLAHTGHQSAEASVKNLEGGTNTNSNAVSEPAPNQDLSTKDSDTKSTESITDKNPVGETIEYDTGEPPQNISKTADIKIPKNIPSRCESLVKSYSNGELTLADYLKQMRKCKVAESMFIQMTAGVDKNVILRKYIGRRDPSLYRQAYQYAMNRMRDRIPSKKEAARAESILDKWRSDSFGNRIEDPKSQVPAAIKSFMIGQSVEERIQRDRKAKFQARIQSQTATALESAKSLILKSVTGKVNDPPSKLLSPAYKKSLVPSPNFLSMSELPKFVKLQAPNNNKKFLVASTNQPVAQLVAAAQAILSAAGQSPAPAAATLARKATVANLLKKTPPARIQQTQKTNVLATVPANPGKSFISTVPNVISQSPYVTNNLLAALQSMASGPDAFSFPEAPSFPQMTVIASSRKRSLPSVSLHKPDSLTKTIHKRSTTRSRDAKDGFDLPSVTLHKPDSLTKTIHKRSTTRSRDAKDGFDLPSVSLHKPDSLTKTIHKRSITRDAKDGFDLPSVSLHKPDSLTKTIHKRSITRDAKDGFERYSVKAIERSQMDMPPSDIQEGPKLIDKIRDMSSIIASP